MTDVRPRIFGFARAAALLCVAAAPLACAGELRGDPESYKVARSAAGPGQEQGCDRAPDIFEATCTSCHNAKDHFGELDLSPDGLVERLVNQPSSDTDCADRKLVDPAMPSQSFLIEKLETTYPACGDRMPLTGDISGEDIACVRAWVVSLGAPPDAAAPAPAPDAGGGGDAQ